MEKIALFCLSFFLVSILDAQDIRFCHDVVVDPSGASATVTVYMINEGSVSENISAYTVRYYYDNTKTNYVSVDYTPTGNLGWTLQTSQSGVSGAPQVPPYNAYVEFQVFDDNFNGTDVTVGAQIDLLIMDFDHALPVMDPEGYLAQRFEGASDLGLQYVGNDFTGHDIERSTGCQASQALPVELTHFQAQLRSNQTTQLDWQTATELNNAGFEVERSQDARSWQKIGFVEGRGTTNEPQDYRLVDPDPRPGLNYYRLKQIDYDGQFEYSPVRSVRLEGLAVHIFPNPVAERSELNVNFTTTPSRGNTSLRIFDISGQLMQQMPLSGQYNRVDIGQLPAGVYFVEVVEGRKTWQERLVVQ